MSKIIAALLDDPTAWRYSLRLGAEAEVAPGTIYPLLAKLEKAGWLESRWEEADDESRRRRLYRLTGAGQRCASAAPVECAPKIPRSRSRRFGFGLPQLQGANP